MAFSQNEHLRPKGPRPSLRYASFINPSTGERLRKTISLHDRSDTQDEDEVDNGEDENLPLLPTAREERGQPATIISKSWSFVKQKSREGVAFVVSDTGKGVLKCAVAYLIASLATFVPALSNLLGRDDSKHLVATITVYFHPARSLGSMIEALILACAAFVYITVVSIASMSVSALFADVFDLIAVGHALVLVFFVGGGIGLVSLYKLKQGNPLVNVASSLTMLGMITILIKEGAVQAGDYSFDKIVQILFMVIAGVLATTLVSLTVFPISARRKVKQNMIDATDSLADMLALITSSFLSGDEDELNGQHLTSVSQRHQKVLKTAADNLREAQREHYLLGSEFRAFMEARLLQCIRRLTGSLGGLRSAAAMQFVITKEEAAFRANTPSAFETPMTSPFQTMSTPSIKSRGGNRAQSVRAAFYGLRSPGTSQGMNGNMTSSDNNPRQKTPAEIFELFIDHLGPSMRSLAYTLKEILDALPFDAADNFAITLQPRFHHSLDRALSMYREHRREALQAVYAQKHLEKSNRVEIQADWEEAAACCGHFSFSLIEVAENVKEYLTILDRLQLEVEEQPRGRSWRWLLFWKSTREASERLGSDAELAALFERTDDMNLEVNETRVKRQVAESPTQQDSKRLRIQRRVFRIVYRCECFFSRDDTKFFIKVSLGAIIYALPSFVEAWRPFYTHWRGEWGLLSYALVVSMTIGASNTTGVSRIFGTCLGAGIAIVVWEVCQENPFALAFCGFCMAYWTAYIIIGRGNGPMGRFIMLTYNLSALYAYTLSLRSYDDDDDEDPAQGPAIIPIALHRVAAVASGCIWGLIVTRVVWPISARQKLKDSLSLLWLRMGLIWKRDPLSILTEGELPNQYLNLREELSLQRFLDKIQALVAAAKSEVDLRGPFPQATYDRILRCTTCMLDAFHAMNVVILKDPNASPGEEALLRITLKERAELCSRISHLFSVLASSMKLEYALSQDALPNTDHSRDRLLVRMFTFRNEAAEREKVSDEDFSLLYSYALVTGQLGVDIQNVLKELENLFGVIDDEALRLQ